MGLLMRALLILLIAALTACAGPSSPLRPVAQVISPPDGARVVQGERIALQVSGAATAGIDRFEARAGSVVLSSYPVLNAPRGASGALVVVPQIPGALTLSVVVIDRNGLTSDPAFLSLNVAPNGLPTAVPTRSTSGGACPLNTAFVSDVTIPDNTPVAAGQPFTKTWRLRNSGACGWDLGYTFVFVDRDPLGAPQSILVGPVAAGGQFEVSVPFIAPGAPGIYTSTWQLRTPEGRLFGARVYAQIRVP